MSKDYKDDIRYTASLVEAISRLSHNSVYDVVQMIGLEGLQLIDRHASVNHCLPFEQVANEIIAKYRVPIGSYNNESESETCPSYTGIGMSYADVVIQVEDNPEKYPERLLDVMKSKVSAWMHNYKSAFWFSPPDYKAYAYLHFGLNQD